jgi:hypothetical protein
LRETGKLVIANLANVDVVGISKNGGRQEAVRR